MDALEFDTRLEALLKRWEDIEESIKQAEVIQGQVTIPAINELRYAGRQIIRAISSSRNIKDGDVYERALACADQYLMNADHDVIDSIVMFIGKRINELNLKFGRASIERNYSPYKDVCDLVSQCQKDIAASRRDANLRNEIYAELRASRLERLISSFQDLFNADLFMSIQLEQLQNKIDQKQIYIYYFIASYVTIGAAVLSYIAFKAFA